MALKFLKENFSYSFDKEFATSAGIGRPSNAHNDDDFDYALELKPDNEYRQVAANNTDFKDFSDIDFEGLLGREDCDSIATFDSKANDEKENDGTSDDGDSEEPSEGRPIEKKTFLRRMFRLGQRQRWVEALSRRSSLAFLQEHTGSQAQIEQNFRELMWCGTSVRLHGKGRYAHKVVLSTCQTGPRDKDKSRSSDNSTIYWEPEETKKLRDYMRQNYMRNASITEVMREGEDDIAEVTMGSCVKCCGCGDGLYGGMATENGSGDSTQLGVLSGNSSECQGSLSVIDIIAIQPGTAEDPLCPGYNATKNFRGSLDEFNPALSFSVVASSSTFAMSLRTLDIECDDEKTYFTLLGGFILLRRAVAAAGSANTRLEKESAALRKLRKGATQSLASIDRASVRLSPQKMASGVKAILSSPRSGIEGFSDGTSDPIGKMFYPERAFSNIAMGPGEEHRGVESFIRGADTKDSGLQPPAQFLGWNTKGTQIWARLRMAGLEVKPVFSWDLKRVILKIRCPSWRLEEVAEKMHVRLKLRTGGYKRFKISQRDLFQPNSYNGSIFRSSDRQRVIDFILRSKIRDGGAELDANTSLGNSIVQRFPLHMTAKLTDLKNSWIYFWKIEKAGEIAEPWSPFSTPLSVTCRRIFDSCAHFYNGLLNQPLDQVAEYYGESVAFYFAWVAYFTRWMVGPSILGVVVFTVQITTGRLDHWICIPYGIFIVIWASLMLVFWRQKQSALAYRWGVLGFEMEETERPQFQGKSVIDPNTKELRKVYPPRKRLLKYLVAVPAMLIMTMGMLTVMMIVLYSQANLAKDYEHGEKMNYVPTPSLLMGGNWHYGNSNSTAVDKGQDPFEAKLTTKTMFDTELWMALLYYPAIYGLFVAIASEFVDKVAYHLTNFENHRKESTYWNRLILKIFCFRFVAVFTPVYYYAFTIQDPEEAYMKMTMTILALMTVGDWWTKILSTCIPAWIHRFKLYRMTLSVAKTNRLIWAAKWALEFNSDLAGDGDEEKKENHRMLLARREKYHNESKSTCWNEALKKEYQATEDYTQMILQLGMVLLFGMVFPLIPLIAVINNLFFLRMDASKLMYTRQRPIAKKIGGLGVWEDVLQIMSVLGLLTNCCIMLFTSHQLARTFAAIGIAGVAIMLFAYEHIVLLFKYFLHATVARVPTSVQRDQERNKILSKTRRNNKKNISGTDNRSAFGSFRTDPAMGSFTNHPIRSGIIGHPQLSSISSFVTDDDAAMSIVSALPRNAHGNCGYQAPSKVTLHGSMQAKDHGGTHTSGPPIDTVRHMLAQPHSRQSSGSSSGLYMSVLSACPSSTTSSSDSDCQSLKSNKKPLVPPALRLHNGPGPVGSSMNMHKLQSASSVTDCSYQAAGAESQISRMLASHTLSYSDTGDVHDLRDEDLLGDVVECEEGTDDDDEEEASWWKIKCDSPIATLGTPRSAKAHLHKSSPRGSTVSRQHSGSVTTNVAEEQFEQSHSMRPGNLETADDKSVQSHNRGHGRASLLQIPIGMAPPKLSRRIVNNPPPSLLVSAPPVLRTTCPDEDSTGRFAVSTYTPNAVPITVEAHSSPHHNSDNSSKPNTPQRDNPSRRSSGKAGGEASSGSPRSRSQMLADLVSPSSPLQEYILSAFPFSRGSPSAPLPRKPETKHSDKKIPRLPPSHGSTPPDGKMEKNIPGSAEWLQGAPSGALSQSAARRGFFASLDSSDFCGGTLNTPAVSHGHPLEGLTATGSDDSSPLTCDSDVPSSTLNTSSIPRADFPLKRRLPSKRHLMTDMLVEALPAVTLAEDGDYRCYEGDDDEAGRNQVNTSNGMEEVPPEPENTVDESLSKSRWGFFKDKKTKKISTPVDASRLKTESPVRGREPIKTPGPSHLRPSPSNPFAALLSPAKPVTDSSGKSTTPSQFRDKNDENSKLKANSPAKKHTTAKSKAQHSKQPMSSSPTKSGAVPKRINAKNDKRTAANIHQSSPSSAVSRSGVPTDGRSRTPVAHSSRPEEMKGVAGQKTKSWAREEKAENPFQQAIGRG